MRKLLLAALLACISALSSAAVIFPIPSGITPDKSSYGGLYGFMQNVNIYADGISIVTTAGTNSTLTAAQVLVGVTKLNAGASGGFTITLPSTAAILNAMGNTIATDGTFSVVISMMNNGVGQTGTLTAGDGSTTLTGTMTVATNTRRMFMLTVTGPTTISIENIGSIAL